MNLYEVFGSIAIMVFISAVYAIATRFLAELREGERLGK